MNNYYPIDKNLKHHFLIAIGLCIWIFIFLYFSEPFDIHKFSETEKLILLPIYGIIQSVCYSIPLRYQQKVLTNYKMWKLKNELIFLVLVVAIGSVINYVFYWYAVIYGEPNGYTFLQYFKLIYLPALTIVLPFVVISRLIMGKLSARINPQHKIAIKGQGKFDFINLRMNDLLFIQSSDNYVEINYLENKMIKKKLIRARLSEIERNFSDLLKTHRSYLINPMHFKQFNIESKKLFIDLDYGILIPVSRGLQAQIKIQLQPTTNR